MSRLIATTALCAVLGACAGQAALDTGKSLAAAWAALDAAALASDTAVHAGKLKGDAARVVAADLTTASAALTIATDAYAGANKAADPVAEILVATKAVAEITTLLGPKP